MFLAGQYFGEQYVNLLLPLYKAMLELVLPKYHVLGLGVGTVNREHVVLAQLVTAEAQTTGTRTLPAGIGLSVSTLSGHALKHAAILFGAIVVWPNISAHTRIVRLLLCIVPLLLIETVDIPLTLAGATKDLVFHHLAPQAVDHSWLLGWLRLLDGGARLALPVFAALAVSTLHDAMHSRCRKIPSQHSL